ncbi:hypothetical protein [Haloarcula pelagica]|uniref:hypothetical protein n=1 Tax=Haloarcula pelagica TaxID=3033389 RepID=UPI0024C2BE99|nr:hypothetical protein [Halomicroarcula sp. YJ-61-S]
MTTAAPHERTDRDPGRPDRNQKPGRPNHEAPYRQREDGVEQQESDDGNGGEQAQRGRDSRWRREASEHRADGPRPASEERSRRA